MADVNWLVAGPRSGLTFVTAPDGDIKETAEAVSRLDEASAQHINPERPPWFRTISKLGYLWYLVIAAIVFVVCLIATDMTATRALVVALIATVVLGPLSSALLVQIARKQAEVPGAQENARRVAADVHTRVHIPQKGVLEAANDVLDASAATPEEVHALTWSASGSEDLSDPDAGAAADELFRLQGVATSSKNA